MRIRVSLLALVLIPMVADTALAQAAPQRPIDVFRTARDYLQVGSLELAAQTFKDFADLKPTDQDYLDIESKYGVNVFQNLRNVPRWIPDAKKDDDFKKTVIEGIIESSIKANEKLTRDPIRLQRFAANLGESKEERDFAIVELNRAGAAAVPFIVDNLRINNTPEYRSGAFTAIERLSIDAIPGFVVAAENLPAELKVGIIYSLARRGDILRLLGKADTNFVPYLWYLSSSDNDDTLKKTASQILRTLSGDLSDRQSVDAELVKYAEPMYLRKGEFYGWDSVSNRVQLSTWDKAKNTLVLVNTTKALAEEQYGLKYLQWAIERKPTSRAVQEMFIAMAVDRAVERSSFGDLSASEPGLSQLLAAAPVGMLIDLLDQAIVEEKTTLVFGLVQTLGARSEKAAAVSTATKPATLVKALNYPDPRVQLAAATAILNIPSAQHGAHSRIVDILTRAANNSVMTNAGSVGTALVADPIGRRGEQVAALVRGLGYDVEQFGTGRDLLKRINSSSDFDLIMIDRHIVDPELSDVLSRLSSNVNSGHRPVLVVASSDEVAAPKVESLLLRLAVLLAVTETTEIIIPPPYENDRRKPKEENDDNRKLNIEERDGRFVQIANGRLARAQRIVEAANIGSSQIIQSRLNLRLPQLIYAVLISEYETTEEYAPTSYRNVKNYTTLLVRQKNLDQAIDEAPSAELLKLIAHLETVLTPAMRQRFEQIRVKLDLDELALPRAPAIDPITEAKLKRLTQSYRNVAVIPEPYTLGSTKGNVKYGLAYDIQATITDPAQRPRDPSEKSASVKLAIDWLNKLAQGARSGYDLKSAVPALRNSLDNDQVASLAISALSRIPSDEAQQDLIRYACKGSYTVPLRIEAVDAAIRHVQTYGKMTKPELDQMAAMAIVGEKSNELVSKITILSESLSGKPTDLSNRIKSYTIPVPPPAAVPAPKNAEPKAPEAKQ